MVGNNKFYKYFNKMPLEAQVLDNIKKSNKKNKDDSVVVDIIIKPPNASEDENKKDVENTLSKELDSSIITTQTKTLQNLYTFVLELYNNGTIIRIREEFNGAADMIVYKNDQYGNVFVYDAVNNTWVFEYINEVLDDECERELHQGREEIRDWKVDWRNLKDNYSIVGN